MSPFGSVSRSKWILPSPSLTTRPTDVARRLDVNPFQVLCTQSGMGWGGDGVGICSASKQTIAGLFLDGRFILI